MKKYLIIFLIISIIGFGAIGLSGCTDDYDDPAASLDYGDDYYYDSGTGKVERSLHGILNDAPEWDN